MFLKEVSNAHQSCIVKCHYNLKQINYIHYLTVIYDGKAEFSASLLQSLVSQDPSEIILIC